MMMPARISEEDVQHILDCSADLLRQLAGQRIFLTGGTGFFGKWLLESFISANDRLKLNAKIIVLSRDPAKFLEKHPFFVRPDIEFLTGDIRDFTFPDHKIDYIIHAATEASVALNMEHPLLMYDTIVEGTRRVLELALDRNAKAVLHTSSGAVYGKQPSDITHVSETFTGSPVVYDKGAAYGEGKRVAEMLCSFYQQRGVNSKVARCFAFVGPHLPLDTTFAIGNFIGDFMAGNRIKVNGDGTPYRSYLYAADLVVWLWHILLKGESCKPYNVGSDEDITIEDLAALVASLSNAQQGYEVMQTKSGQPPARYVPDISRAKNELGLAVRIGLREGIKRTIAYYSRSATTV